MKTRYSLTFALLIVFLIALITYANISVSNYREFTYNQVNDLPVEKACLVLGTSKVLADGRINLFYKYRIEAAKQVYMAGKCSKIVVSGDNRYKNYNEPETMKQSLIAVGIPANHIYCDYAGIRTLDSVLRFKFIFGQATGIVISQQFHNERAIYLARNNGIDLIGFNAQEVDVYNGFRTQVRELFSRVKAVIDVNILHKKAKHYGEPISL